MMFHKTMHLLINLDNFATSNMLSIVIDTFHTIAILELKHNLDGG